MKRLNITLPEQIIEEIKNIPNKSRFITQALKEKLERIKREKLDRLLMGGYKAGASNSSWHHLRVKSEVFFCKCSVNAVSHWIFRVAAPFRVRINAG